LLNGVTILAAHTKAFFRATDIVKPGLTKRASLSLSLVAVMVAGQRVSVETSKLESKGGSQKKRTGKAAVIGGATGAVFGAVFGGAAGAGVGAAVGAASGAVVSRVLQRGVDIPAESRFTYKLSQDAVLNYAATPASAGETVPPHDIQPPAVVTGQPPTAPEAPAPIPPPPPPPVDAKELKLGESVEKVVADFGQPDKIVTLGAKQIYIYKDMKVTFVDGKLTNFE
jgi:hypothetical protein